jgi:hypothetical protein
MGPTGTLTFACSICAEASHDICVYCTKDVCRLHRCQRCLRCSDCCECESPLCLDEEPVAPPAEVSEVGQALSLRGALSPAPPGDGVVTTEPDPASPDEPPPGALTGGAS